MTKVRFEDFALRLREDDDVAIIKRPIKANVELVSDSFQISTRRDIPAGHKIAVTAIADGAPLRRYGQIIGFAKGDIVAGDHVHTHNLVMKDFNREYEFCVDARPVEYYPVEQMRTFAGYAKPGAMWHSELYRCISA
jgi:altronate hydrolase